MVQFMGKSYRLDLLALHVSPLGSSSRCSRSADATVAFLIPLIASFARKLSSSQAQMLKVSVSLKSIVD